MDKIAKYWKLILLLSVFLYTASNLRENWEEMNWNGAIIVTVLVWIILSFIKKSKKKSEYSAPLKGEWNLYCPICKKHFSRIGITTICPHCGAQYNLNGENEALDWNERRKEKNKVVTVWICGCKKNNIQTNMNYNYKCKKCGYSRPDWDK